MAASRKKSEMAIRRAQVWDLYTQGHDQVTVASILDISQKTVSRDINYSLEEFRKERIEDIERFRTSELASLNKLELEVRENIQIIKEYLYDKAKGNDRECPIRPTNLAQWTDTLLKIKAQKSKIGGLDKETIKVESDTPIEVTLNIRGKKSEETPSN